jgi:hypothetical protein
VFHLSGTGAVSDPLSWTTINGETQPHHGSFGGKPGDQRRRGRAGYTPAAPRHPPPNALVSSGKQPPRASTQRATRASVRRRWRCRVQRPKRGRRRARSGSMSAMTASTGAIHSTPRMWSPRPASARHCWAVGHTIGTPRSRPDLRGLGAWGVPVIVGTPIGPPNGTPVGTPKRRAVMWRGIPGLRSPGTPGSRAVACRA